MRTRFVGVAIALGALTLGGGTPAHAASPKCSARNSTTILQTQSVRIYYTPLGNTAARVYGCMYSRNRRHLLGVDGDCDPHSIGEVKVRGRYAAYVESFCNIDASDDYVTVKDLKTGQNKYRAIAATGESNGEPSTIVTDFVLSSSGSVAWIADWQAQSGGTPDPNDNRQVRKLEPGAPQGGTLLDSGTQIEPRSLALGSRTSAGYAWLYWTKNGAAVAAKLN
jgi:hypothetical protein